MSCRGRCGLHCFHNNTHRGERGGIKRACETPERNRKAGDPRLHSSGFYPATGSDFQRNVDTEQLLHPSIIQSSIHQPVNPLRSEMSPLSVCRISALSGKTTIIIIIIYYYVSSYFFVFITIFILLLCFICIFTHFLIIFSSLCLVIKCVFFQ